jgi:hypothetical protein
MNGPNKPNNYYAGPWKLKGEGIILGYNFKEVWVEENGFLKEELKGKFNGGLGYIMLVRYTQSPVGPYNEILFIPGKFNPSGRHTITKIYVDSESSTQNGRYKWGIPKNTVPIIWQKNINSDIIGVGSEEDPILHCKVSYGGIPFPVTTKFLPIKLHQELEGKTFLTSPKGHGWGKLAKIESMKVNSDYFPNISKLKPIICIKVNPFTMEFPLAEQHADQQ